MISVRLKTILSMAAGLLCITAAQAPAIKIANVSKHDAVAGIRESNATSYDAEFDRQPSGSLETLREATAQGAATSGKKPKHWREPREPREPRGGNNEPHPSVPEPSSLTLLGAGLVAAAVWNRRRLGR